MKGKGLNVIVLAFAAACLGTVLTVSLIAVTTQGIFGTRTITSTSVVEPSPQLAVTNRVVEFVWDLNNFTSAPLAGFYTDSSVARWYGNQVMFGLNGTYKGQTNIAGTGSALYSGFLEQLHEFDDINATVSFVNLAIDVIQPNMVNATFRVLISGYNSRWGTISAQADVEQQWVSQGATWTILSDNWDYLFSTLPSTIIPLSMNPM